VAGSSPSERVAALAESFVERYRRGERPSVREYTDRHPDLAADIREVFPAVAMMENVALDADALGPASPTSPPVSQVGDFRIVREVGRGGMGVVYEAEQLSLGRYVALKLLPGHSAATDRQKERFLREARAAARLHHTNIVPVFGFGEADGVPYYAMQFICGQGVDAVIDELRARVAAGPPAAGPVAELTRSLVTGEFRPADATAPIPPGSATPPAPRSALSGEAAAGTGRWPLWRGIARLGLQVANALDHAHQLGVLHRDVKPSNLLLDLHGTAWVTDFGLAKTEGQPDLTQDGDVLGTLRYLPPEALDGKADARGDVFALGLCLYELLALRPAYDAPDRSGLVRQVTAADPPPLRTLIPGLPRDLATVVHKAIQREPERRYRSAAALADDLGRWLDGRPIAARPVSAVGHAWRACKRNPWASGMAAAAAFALVAGTAAALWGRAAAVANETAALSAAESLRQERDVVARLNAEAADRLYGADMNRAQLSWYGGNVSLVRDLLAAHRPAPTAPDRRGIEWYYLNRLVNTPSRVIPTHVRRYPVLLISPRGDRIVTATGAAVEAWTDTGEPAWTYPGADKSPFWYSAAFSPNGDRLAYTDIDGEAHVLKILDATDGKVVATVPGVRDDTTLAFSPRENVMVGGSTAGPVRVWDTATWKELKPLAGHRTNTRQVVFTPDGTRLVTAGRGEAQELRVWDTGQSPWKLVKVCDDEVGPLDSLAVRADGGRAVGCSGGEVRAWDLSATPPRLMWRRACAAYRLAYHPDGRRVFLACNDSVVRVLDVETGGELDPLRGHANAVEAVAVRQDGATAVSAGRDRTIRVWPLPAVTDARQFAAGKVRVSSAALSPDGAELVTAGLEPRDRGTVVRWDARSGARLGDLAAFQQDAQRVRFSPDGRWLVCARQDGVLTCWATAGGRTTPAWEVTAHAGHLGATDIDFDPAAGHVMSVGWDKTLKITELATGRQVREIPTPKRVNWNACYRPGGKQVAVSCDLHSVENHSSVIVYDATTGRDVFRLTDARVSHAVPRYSPDGRVLYAAVDGVNVGAWDAATGQPFPVVFKGHTGWVLSIAPNSDGTRLLTASRDGTARIWDTATGHELLALRGHTRIVREAAFTPAGDGILTTSEDGTARIWDAPRK
jgi:WD40 repeat protein/serine/threonine protein kinase